MEKTVNIVNKSAPRCPYCHEDISAQSDKTGCESCMAWHHKACWNEHGRCSVCGREDSSLSENAAGDEAPIIEDRERICAIRNCELRVQDIVSAPGYNIRCQQHASNFAQKKATRYKAIQILFGILSLGPILFSLFAKNPNEDLRIAMFPAFACSVATVLLFIPKAIENKKVLKQLTGSESAKNKEPKRKSFV